jgi:hypothetical protein
MFGFGPLDRNLPKIPHLASLNKNRFIFSQLEEDEKGRERKNKNKLSVILGQITQRKSVLQS